MKSFVASSKINAHLNKTWLEALPLSTIRIAHDRQEKTYKMIDYIPFLVPKKPLKKGQYKLDSKNIDIFIEGDKDLQIKTNLYLLMPHVRHKKRCRKPKPGQERYKIMRLFIGFRNYSLQCHR